LKFRRQFAERHPRREEVSNALETYGSWHEIVNSALPSESKGVGNEYVEPGPLPEGTFRTVVADPPWQYGNTKTRGVDERALTALSNYPKTRACGWRVPHRAGLGRREA